MGERKSFKEPENEELTRIIVHTESLLLNTLTAVMLLNALVTDF